MVVTRQSQLTGKRNTMEINISEECFFLKFPRLKKELIQNVFPELSAEEREFLISGITPEEWETLKNDCEENAIPYDEA